MRIKIDTLGKVIAISKLFGHNLYKHTRYFEQTLLIEKYEMEANKFEKKCDYEMVEIAKFKKIFEEQKLVEHFIKNVLRASHIQMEFFANKQSVTEGGVRKKINKFENKIFKIDSLGKVLNIACLIGFDMSLSHEYSHRLSQIKKHIKDKEKYVECKDYDKARYARNKEILEMDKFIKSFTKNILKSTVMTVNIVS